MVAGATRLDSVVLCSGMVSIRFTLPGRTSDTPQQVMRASLHRLPAGDFASSLCLSLRSAVPMSGVGILDHCAISMTERDSSCCENCLGVFQSTIPVRIMATCSVLRLQRRQWSRANRRHWGERLDGLRAQQCGAPQRAARRAANQLPHVIGQRRARWIAFRPLNGARFTSTHPIAAHSCRPRCRSNRWFLARRWARCWNRSEIRRRDCSGRLGVRR